MRITRKLLHHYFIYRNGCLFNRITRSNRALKGALSGSVRKDGYSTLNVNRIRIYVHRAIWIYFYGDILEGYEIDHFNGDPSDNRIENLRLVTHLDNLHNQKIRSTNTSGCSGVWYHTQSGKWAAEIKVYGQKKYLGIYPCKKQAIDARREAEIKYNFIVRE